MPPWETLPIVFILLARQETIIKTTKIITMPIIAMMIPYPVVAFSASRTEKIPKEESNMITKMRDTMAGKIIFM
jgi:hypothetical protein